MIKVKNTLTGEIQKVFNIDLHNGSRELFVARNPVTKRFLNSYQFMGLAGKSESGADLLRIIEGSGYEITGNYRGARDAKEPEPKREPETEQPKHPETEEPKNAPQPPKEAAKVATTEDDDARQLAAILARMKGGNVDAEAVRDIVREELANMKPQRTELYVKVAEMPERKVDGFQHPQLAKVLTMVANDRTIGRSPWLYGPAGSGKSTLAKAVADAMGLPFYSVSSLQQKYELEGYADAQGSFVETTFFKAFKDGGVFCFDEASTSPAEVQIAFNTALAQRVYNFPVVGMIEAHKDFHVIAADNTTGRGGNKTYHARYELDASTLDRYINVAVEYTDEFDEYMAQGDTELVSFAKDVRKAIQEANTNDLCTPRALKSVKALQACGMSDEDAIELGMFSGMNPQARRTIINAINGRGKYYKAAAHIV